MLLARDLGKATLSLVARTNNGANPHDVAATAPLRISSGRLYDLRMVRIELASWRWTVAVVMTGALISTSAAAGAAVQAPSCAPANLAATVGGQGATQSLLGGVTVTNHGRHACRLAGRPTIAMPGGSPGEVLSERTMNTATLIPNTRFDATLLLDPGHSATADFQWFNWCNPQAHAPPTSTAAEGRRPSQVRVALAAGAAGIVATVRAGLHALSLPVCGAPRQPSLLYVSLWATGP